jgi:hypothetical protein
MNGQEQFEYELLIERLGAVMNECNRTVREISQQKTRVENELDRLLRHVHQVFGDHPNFDQLAEYGYYDNWTGAGIE